MLKFHWQGSICCNLQGPPSWSWAGAGLSNGVSGISLTISNAYFILHRVFAYIQSNIKILKNNNTIKHSYFKLFVRFLSVKVTNSKSNRNFLNQFWWSPGDLSQSFTDTRWRDFPDNTHTVVPSLYYLSPGLSRSICSSLLCTPAWQEAGVLQCHALLVEGSSGSPPVGAPSHILHIGFWMCYTRLLCDAFPGDWTQRLLLPLLRGHHL